METRPKALVIDDSEHVLTYLSVCLDRMNFDVYPIQFGVNALNLIQVFNPDIFFLDVNMPVLGGLEVLRHIREYEEFSDTPIVMLSEKKEDARECLSRGANFFIEKPIKIDQLHKAVALCYQNRKIPRRHLRTPMNRPVCLYFEDKYYTCQAITLSEGGIYIRRVAPLPVGTRVEVEMGDITDENIRLKGEVIYNKSISGRRFSIPPGMAVRFTDVSAEEADKVHKIVSELLIGDIMNEQVEQVLTLQ